MAVATSRFTDGAVRSTSASTSLSGQGKTSMKVVPASGPNARASMDASAKQQPADGTPDISPLKARTASQALPESFNATAPLTPSQTAEELVRHNSSMPEPPVQAKPLSLDMTACPSFAYQRGFKPAFSLSKIGSFAFDVSGQRAASAAAAVAQMPSVSEEPVKEEKPAHPFAKLKLPLPSWNISKSPVWNHIENSIRDLGTQPVRATIAHTELGEVAVKATDKEAGMEVSLPIGLGGTPLFSVVGSVTLRRNPTLKRSPTALRRQDTGMVSKMINAATDVIAGETATPEQRDKIRQRVKAVAAGASFIWFVAGLSALQGVDLQHDTLNSVKTLVDLALSGPGAAKDLLQIGMAVGLGVGRASG